MPRLANRLGEIGAVVSIRPRPHRRHHVLDVIAIGKVDRNIGTHRAAQHSNRVTGMNDRSRYIVIVGTLCEHRKELYALPSVQRDLECLSLWIDDDRIGTRTAK